MASKKTKKEQAAERRRVATIVINYFNTKYGKDTTRLEGWQDLCRGVDVEVEETIKECKRNLKEIFLNIVDFVNAKESGGYFERFESRKKLSKYIKETGRIFPLKKAKKNLFLKWMLIEVTEL